MMSGDSPTPHSELLFELKETNIHAPVNAKCMQDKAVQFDPNVIEETSTSANSSHQTLVVQEMNHSFEMPHAAPPPSRPVSNRRSIENEEAIERIEEIASSSHVDTRPLTVNEEGVNVDSDQQDGRLFQEPEPKPDDGCGVQCLYYTMQCCECTIL
ncbi:hypothetical protein C0J52_06821 [Blattella germanica]|nr:hypothetical protein C0J52_06821 [Blattella germanica]